MYPILSPGKDAKATVTMALPEAIGITEASEHKEAAQKFVEWYTSADMQKEFYNKEHFQIELHVKMLH